MKSPQPFKNANTATVITAERASGTTMRRNVCHSDAPSTLAACITSFGRLKKKARSTRMAKGMAYVPSAIMRPGYVFTRWIQWKMMNSEVAKTIEGTIWHTRRAADQDNGDPQPVLRKRVGRRHGHDQGQHRCTQADEEASQHVA